MQRIIINNEARLSEAVALKMVLYVVNVSTISGEYSPITSFREDGVPYVVYARKTLAGAHTFKIKLGHS